METIINEVAVIIIAAAIAWIAQQVHKKTGIEITEKQRKRVHEIGMEAVAFVEEFAADYLRVYSKKLTPSEKHARGILYIDASVDLEALSHITPAEKDKDALLTTSLARTKGAGSTRNKVIT